MKTYPSSKKQQVKRPKGQETVEDFLARGGGIEKVEQGATGVPFLDPVKQKAGRSGAEQAKYAWNGSVKK